jgi:hypothetical protein
VNVSLQRGGDVASAYRVSGTPAAVWVRPDYTVGSDMAVGGADIEGLVARVLFDASLAGG